MNVLEGCKMLTPPILAIVALWPLDFHTPIFCKFRKSNITILFSFINREMI